MKTKKLSGALFFRNKAAVILTAVFFAAVTGLAVYYFIKISPYIGLDSQWDAPTVIFWKTQSFSEYFFIFFVFVTHICVSDINRRKAGEVLKATIKGIKLVYKDIISSLLLINAVFTVVFFIINVIAAVVFEIATADFILLVFLSQLLNYFLTSCLGIAVGLLSGSMNNIVAGYLAALLTAAITSPLVTAIIPDMAYMSTGVSLFGITKFLDIFVPNTNFLFLFGFGMSVLPYRFALVFFWLAVVLIIFAAKSVFLSVSCKKQRNLFLKLTSVVAALSLAVFIMPSSKVVKNNDITQAGLHDTEYYSNPRNSVEERISIYEKDSMPFSVSDYKIKFTVLSQLYAEATLTLTEDSYNRYYFTLYHGYKLTEVTDDEGRAVIFSHSGDDVQILLYGTTSKTFTFKYHGYSPQFYSNLQGLCLPAGFAFYPIAGVNEVYNTKASCFNALLTDDNTNFDVSVVSDKKVYCNFEETGKKHFSGTGNALTLVSGFYKDYTVNGLTFIYPYLHGDSSEALFEQYSNDILNTPGADELAAGKKIFATDSLNQGAYSVFASDHVVMHSGIYGLDNYIEDYMEAKINDIN